MKLIWKEKIQNKRIVHIGPIKITYHKTDFTGIKDDSWQNAMEICANAKNLIDIGCGPFPHANSKVAVDKYISKTEHRSSGLVINKEEIRKQNIKFVEASADNLPFKDKEFDVSITKHMIEHVEDPIAVLKEIVRVSNEGFIVCPNVFAEYIFARKAHLWYVTMVGENLIFIKKNKKFDLPFGNLPMKDKKGKLFAQKDTNPFDILLNSNNWYKKRWGGGKEKLCQKSQ